MDSSRKVLAMNPIMIRIKTKKTADVLGQKVEETIARKVAPGPKDLSSSAAQLCH